MTRLTDLPPDQAKRLAELECPDFETRPWVTGPALSQRRVAIVSSAGLVVRGENPFRGRDRDYRAIPAIDAARDLLCSHISINFDRTGFQEDWNVVFPLDRLQRAGGRGDDRLGGRRRTTPSWARPIRADGAVCPRTRRPAEAGRRRRRRSSPRFDRSARAP